MKKSNKIIKLKKGRNWLKLRKCNSWKKPQLISEEKAKNLNL